MTEIKRKRMSDWLRQKIVENYEGAGEQVDDLEDFEIEQFEEEFGPEPEPTNVEVRSPAEGQREPHETQGHQELSATQERAEQREAMAERIEKEPYDQIVELFKERVKSVEEENMGQIEEYVSRERSREITRFYKALEDVQAYIKDHHRKELWAKGEYFRSLHWISGDAAISAALEKTKFFEVAHYLDTHNLDRESPRVLKLAKGAKHATVVQSGEQKGKEVEHDYALILANKEFFRKASEKLSLSEISIKKYLQRFCEIGLLKRVVRTGREWLYADGYWLKWDKTAKPRKIRFLKDNPETRDALRNFRLSAKT